MSRAQILGSGLGMTMQVDLSSSGTREDSPHLDEFVIHAALDLVDEAVWTTGHSSEKQKVRVLQSSVIFD